MVSQLFEQTTLIVSKLRFSIIEIDHMNIQARKYIAEVRVIF
jgi:hypothetical protein